MKLICASCNCFIQSIATKIKTNDPVTPFLFYHQKHTPPNAQIIKSLPINDMIKHLNGKNLYTKTYRKICKYSQCNAIFITKDSDRLFCNKECSRLHFNEMNKLRNQNKRNKQKSLNISIPKNNTFNHLSLT